MSKSVLTYLSENMNNAKESDDDCIKTLVALDPQVTKSIEIHKNEKDKIEGGTPKEPIVTASDIREEMMRQMTDEYTRQ